MSETIKKPRLFDPEEFVEKLDKYMEMIIANAIYQAKPGDPDDSCAGCYPPHRSESIQQAREELLNVLS